MKIKTVTNKSKKRDRRWYEEKPPRPMGRLAQLSKVRHKRTDSEAIALWKKQEKEKCDTPKASPSRP